MRRSFFRRRVDARIAEAGDDLQVEAESPADQPAAAQPRPFQRKPGAWRDLAEQRIQEGIEQGLFDNLPGAGKPLNLDDDAFVPPDLRMAFRLLRSNGLAPLWIELNKEIRDDITRLARFRAHVRERTDPGNAIQRDHLRKEYIGRIHEINAKIVNYNILAPSSHVHLAALILEDELTKFDEL